MPIVCLQLFDILCILRTAPRIHSSPASTAPANPHRSALSPDEALLMVRSGSGTRFDPKWRSISPQRALPTDSAEIQVIREEE